MIFTTGTLWFNLLLYVGEKEVNHTPSNLFHYNGTLAIKIFGMCRPNLYSFTNFPLNTTSLNIEFPPTYCKNPVWNFKSKYRSTSWIVPLSCHTWRIRAEFLLQVTLIFCNGPAPNPVLNLISFMKISMSFGEITIGSLNTNHEGIKTYWNVMLGQKANFRPSLITKWNRQAKNPNLHWIFKVK